MHTEIENCGLYKEIVNCGLHFQFRFTLESRFANLLESHVIFYPATIKGPSSHQRATLISTKAAARVANQKGRRVRGHRPALTDEKSKLKITQKADQFDEP